MEIALFRFSLISQLIHLDDEDTLYRAVYDIARKTYDIPYSTKNKLSAKTIKRYLRLYREKGFEGLYPKIRNDKNKMRSMPGELIGELLKYKKEEPRRSVTTVIELVSQKEQFKGLKIAKRSVSRLFANHGLNSRSLKVKKFYRSFEMNHINELWQTDISDGLFIKEQKKMTYLFAFLDDHSRLVPHGQFYSDEKLPRLEDCLKKAILKRGIPRAIYADNGKIFISNHFKRICAELGIRLMHTLPYSPESKGKIERFFLRVKKQFLIEAAGAGITSLQQLNSYFAAWLEVKYHRTEHHALGTTPLDRFTGDMKQTKIRRVESLEEITEIFLYRENRKVADKRGRIKFYQAHYHLTDVSLFGKTVEVRYDPFDLSKLYVYTEGVCREIAYRGSGNPPALPAVPEENRTEEQTIRKSSITFFHRLKQKELELNKKEIGTIDFTKLPAGDDNDK